MMERMEREQGEGSAEMSKPSEKCLRHVCQFEKAMTPPGRQTPGNFCTAIDHPVSVLRCFGSLVLWHVSIKQSQ